MDGVTIEMLCRALDDCLAWTLFFFSLLGIALAVILVAVLAVLLLRVVWRFFVVNSVNRLIVSLERKALRQ